MKKMITHLSRPRLLAVIILGAVSAGLRADDKPAAGPAPIRSAQSGLWSKPATWEGGKVPGAGARVLVRQGHALTYDVKSDQAIRLIRVAGTLRFAHDKDTRLDVGLIRVEVGDQCSEEGFDCDAHVAEPDADRPRPTLEVGSSDHPIEAG